MSRINNRIDNIFENINNICSQYKFEYRIRIDNNDGYCYLFFVGDGTHPNTNNGIRILERFGFERYEFGIHCYAFYYRIKI